MDRQRKVTLFYTVVKKVCYFDSKGQNSMPCLAMHRQRYLAPKIGRISRALIPTYNLLPCSLPRNLSDETCVNNIPITTVIKRTEPQATL